MKALIVNFSLLTLFSTLSFATDKITTIDANNIIPELAALPQQFMATFVDQGFKQIQTSKKIFKLTIKKLRCDSQSRNALFPDYSNAGLRGVSCFVNAKEGRGQSGRPILESRFIDELLLRLEKNVPDLEISDCAMGGKCTSFIKEMNCFINLNKEEMHDAYSCQFTTYL